MSLTFGVDRQLVNYDSYSFDEFKKEMFSHTLRENFYLYGKIFRSLSSLIGFKFETHKDKKNC